MGEKVDSMYKHLTSFVLVLLLAAAGVACGGDGGSSAGDGSGAGDSASVSDFCARTHAYVDAAGRLGYEYGAVEVPDETTSADQDILDSAPDIERQMDAISAELLNMSFDEQSQFAVCMGEFVAIAP